MRDRDKFIAGENLNGEQKILIAHTDDMMTSASRGRRKFSSFLTEGEAALVKRYAASCGEDVLLYGGFEGAQRVMAGFFPRFEEPDESLFPLTRLFIGGRMTDGLTHRDYLGSILGLGIERNMTGDIVPSDGGAYVILADTAAELVMRELEKVGRVGVRCRICSDKETIKANDNIRFRRDTVASLRLDCIVSSCTDLSREKSAGLIRSGAVDVDHICSTDVSSMVSVGSIISVRKYGRYVLYQTSDRTKKDRIPVIIGKYI